MIFFAKNGECDEVIKVCKQLGRGDDIIRVTPGGPYRFNFMDWIAQFGASGASEDRGSSDDRGPIPTVALLEEIGSAVSPEAAGAGSNENAFFEGAHRTLLGPP